MSKFKVLPLCLAVLSAEFVAVEVQAQEVCDNQIEEVVVTARKRSESLQEVPLSITPFSADTMERRDLVNLEDIANDPHDVGIVSQFWKHLDYVLHYQCACSSGRSDGMPGQHDDPITRCREFQVFGNGVDLFQK